MAVDAPSSAETQVQVRFETKLPKKFHIPNTTFAVPSSLNRYGLSEVVNTLLGSTDEPQPFDFVVQGTLLRSSLYKCLLSHGLSTEAAIIVEYILAGAPPGPKRDSVQEDWVSAVCCSPSHSVVISGSYDSSVRVYSSEALGLHSEDQDRDDHNLTSASTSALHPQLTIPAHKAAITTVVLANAPSTTGSEGKCFLVLSGSKDQSLRLTKVTCNQPPGPEEFSSQTSACLIGHQSAVQCADVSSNSSQACSGSWDGTLLLWSLSSLADLENKAKEDGTPASEDSTASVKEGGKKRRTAISDVASMPQMEVESSLRAHTGAVASVSYIKGQRQDGGDDGGDGANGDVVSGSWDHTVRLWDTSAQANTNTMTTAHPVLSVDAFGGGERSLIAAGGAQKVLLMWDLRSKGSIGPSMQLTSHKSWITTVKWCPDRDHPYQLLSASYDGTIKIWDIRATVPLHTVQAHPKSKVLCADWWSSSAFVSGGTDNKLNVFW